MSLHNKSILITRPAEQAAELIAEIQQRGGRVVLFPTIKILPPESWDHCDLALASLEQYTGLVVTSRNGVEKFFGRLRERGIPLSRLDRCRVYAVGKKTGDAAGETGVSVHIVPEQYSADALVNMFADDAIGGARYLFPCGNLTSGTLEKALRAKGAIVDTVMVYRTVPPDEMDTQRISRLILEGGVDVVTFASPSAARNFAAVISRDVLSRAPERVRIAVIGPTTRKEVESLGLHADILAEESTSGGLARAVELYFA